jgi:hypothetical protein
MPGITGKLGRALEEGEAVRLKTEHGHDVGMISTETGRRL